VSISDELPGRALGGLALGDLGGYAYIRSAKQRFARKTIMKKGISPTISFLHARGAHQPKEGWYMSGNLGSAHSVRPTLRPSNGVTLVVRAWNLNHA